MKLTQLAVKRPVATAIILAGVILFGFLAMFSMEQELTPEMNMPLMLVATTYVGAGPEDVNKQITSEIEGSVGTLSGIQKVMSQSMENMSLVILNYEYGTDMNEAYIDLMSKIHQLSNVLPSDAGTPIIMEMDISAMASMYLSVGSERVEDLLNYVKEEVVPEFEKLSSIADVTVSGGREAYIRIELREERMQQYGISMAQIVDSVGSADFALPVGDVAFGNENRAVRSQIEYRTLGALRNMPISLGNGSIIRLEDVAQIYDAYRETDSASRYNGQDTVTIGLNKRQSSSAGALSKQAMRVIEQLNADEDIAIEIIEDTSERIFSSLRSVFTTLLVAIFISMAVLYVFFGDMRASLIVGSSMPVSLLITFILMDAMGFSMNIITLSAMVIGVGMMVDNSIVVLDSCFRNQDKNRAWQEAAIEGTRFVLFSIIGGTLTTVVVFFPLATIAGMSGQMFKPLGYTIIFSLTASLISAVTLVPLFFVQFQPRERREAPAALLLKKTELAYGRLLKRLLPRTKTVILTTVAFLAVSLVMATQLNVELIGTVDEGTVQISVETKPGLRVEEQDAIVRTLEEMVAAHPDVDRYSVSVGGSGLSALAGASNTVTAYLKSDRSMKTSDVVEQWQRETQYMTDCSLSIESYSMMSMMGGDDIEINLKGDDLDTLRDFSKEVSDRMERISDVVRVSSNVTDGNPQIEVVVDPLKAAAHSLSVPQVSQTIAMALNGVNPVDISRDGQSYKVYVEYPKGRYQTANDLENMILLSPSGASVPLMDVAGFRYTNAPQTIAKEDNQYLVTITGTPRRDTKFAVEKEIDRQISLLDFPQGVSLSESSMQESMTEELSALLRAILVAVVLVFMVMTIQFESVRYSVMVMLCIPFSMIGSFLFLFLTRSTISMVSMMGFLTLVGTVVNNGILFVDTTNEYRKAMPVETALIQTGRHRLRPILMTTLTTILSMVPLCLGIGQGGELMQSMGLTVVGGLTASTLLTLLLLPTFYLIFDKGAEKRRRRRERTVQTR